MSKEVVSDNPYSMDDIPEGLQDLVEGYVDYAKDIISNRVLPDGRDGLKPVVRRALHVLNTDKDFKSGNLVKCQSVMGSTVKFHPHGEGSIYKAMVGYIDETNSKNIPLLHGDGAFGKIHNTNAPAASRYTHCCLHKNAKKFYFNELSGVDYAPNEDNTSYEPKVLPVSFPALLANPTSGIAVGFSCNFPAFNIGDIVDLVIEKLDTGEYHSVIYPDFTTGGYYIKNDKEIKKIMETGKGKLKLRGKAYTNGKYIDIMEYPYGVTIQGLISQINNKDIAKNCSNLDDYDHGSLLRVECSSKNKVESTLMQLYKDTDFQTNYDVAMVAVIDGVPRMQGVYGWLDTWLDWRREVLRRQYTKDKEDLELSLARPKLLLDFISNRDNVNTLVELLANKEIGVGINFLESLFPDTSRDDLEWLANRRTNEFNKGGKYLNTYNNILSKIEMYDGYLKDLDSIIKAQLLEVKAELSTPRRTEITTVDYNFVENTEEVVDDSDCVFLYKDGFLKKVAYATDEDEKTSKVIYAKANSVLIGFDNRGQILRVYCENISFVSAGNLGVYIPKYLGLDDDTEIMWLDILDGSKKILLYRDGNVGLLDTSEFLDTQRQIKVIKGIHTDSANIIGVLDYCDAIRVFDNEGHFAVATTATIKFKSRTARTRVFKPKEYNYIQYYSGTDMNTLINTTPRYAEYIGTKLNSFKEIEDVPSDYQEFTPARII